MTKQGWTKKLVLAAALVFCGLTAMAQGFPPAAAPPWAYADNFGRWSVALQAPGTYTFSPTSVCYDTQLNYTGKQFYDFANTVALAPVFIQDPNSANSEVVTPGSFFTPTSTTCGVNVSPANSHKIGALVASGTGGLQEAMNSISGSTAPYQTTIVLSQEWYKLVSSISGQNATLANSTTPADVITNATCTTKAQLVDVTADPWAWYSCNPSTSKLAVSNAASKAPSVAASTGAGTGPTIAVIAGSSAVSASVTLTTGTTPTASATIFTLTFPTAANGGYNYAPSCTVTSVGTQAYTGTIATSAGSGTPTLTYTATSTALAASTAGYKWYVSCH